MRRTVCRRTPNPLKYGANFLPKGELRQKSSPSAPRPTGTASACRAGVFSTTTPRKIGGAAREYPKICLQGSRAAPIRSEEHTSELQSQSNLVCRLLLEKKK